MNEQQLADLLSEQIDRMLAGEGPSGLDDAADKSDLQDLLEISNQISQTEFQAGSAAQTAFQSQMGGWFGLGNGGSAMTILGLPKFLFISIVTIVVAVGGAGLVMVMATSLIVYNASGQVPASPTSATGTPIPVPSASITATAIISVAASATATTTVVAAPTVAASVTPDTPPVVDFPTLIFRNDISIAVLCQGAYTTQRVLVNYGGQPVDDAALVWEVIDGTDLVDDVNINSPATTQASNLTLTDTGSTLNTSAGDPELVPLNTAYFNPIPVEQDVKLDVKVKVKDDWWNKPNGTKIKVKLSVKNKHKRHHGHHHGHDQVVTIVKQGAQWVTLSGVAHNYGSQSYLVDGNIVTINDCTGGNLNLALGSNVQVTGLLQPNGTFMAVNINVVNVTIINADFDSGAPEPGGSRGGSKGNGEGDGGGGKGGSKGGGGGSRGGSKGGSRKN